MEESLPKIVVFCLSKWMVSEALKETGEVDNSSSIINFRGLAFGYKLYILKQQH